MSNAQQQKELQDALELVMRSLNAMSGEKERQATVKEFFRYQHRTLQQNFMRVLIVPVLEQLDEMYQNGQVDMRNQAAAEMAIKMLEAVGDELYLPLV